MGGERCFEKTRGDGGKKQKHEERERKGGD